MSRALTGFIIALLCALQFGGCASQTTSAKVTISEGCMVIIEGISTRQADEILRTWEIDPNCKVEVRSTAGDDDDEQL